MPLAWGLLGFVVYPVLVAIGWWYVRAAERNERAFTDVVERRDRPMSHTFGAVAVLVVSVLTVGIGIWGLRFSRTTSDFFVASRTVAPGPQRLRHRRRVPLRRLVPRRRRAGAGVRRRHALVPGRLDRRLPRPARPRRRPAAPVGRLHAPDFAQARLRSRPVRVVTSALVVAIGWLYLIPQFKGAGFTLDLATGLDTRLGGLVVALVVLVNVVTGGMRSVTFVQAFQYWLKLTALLVPAVFLLLVWLGDGATSPADPMFDLPGQSGWADPLSGLGHAPALHDVLDHHRDVPRHHGPAARGRPLLHQPRRPRRPPHDAGRARPARDLLRAPAGVRRPRPDLRRRPGRRRAAPTPWCSSCPLRMIGGTGGELLAALLVGRRVRGVPVDLVGPDHRGRRRAVAGRDEPVARRHRVVPGGRGRSPSRSPTRWRCWPRTSASPPPSGSPSPSPPRRSARCSCSASGGAASPTSARSPGWSSAG